MVLLVGPVGVRGSGIMSRDIPLESHRGRLERYPSPGAAARLPLQGTPGCSFKLRPAAASSYARLQLQVTPGCRFKLRPAAASSYARLQLQVTPGLSAASSYSGESNPVPLGRDPAVT
jgi:hypothetical protein